LETDSKTGIITDVNAQRSPSIYNDIILFQEGFEIFKYNLSNQQKAQVTSGYGIKYNPVMSGDMIAWDVDTDVYVCRLSLNGNKGGCLSADQKTKVGQVHYPSVHNNIITWRSSSGILVCDITKNGQSSVNGQIGGCLETDTKKIISTGIIMPGSPVVYNDKIVFFSTASANKGVYLYDLSRDVSAKIISGGAIPSLYENKVVSSSQNPENIWFYSC